MSTQAQRPPSSRGPAKPGGKPGVKAAPPIRMDGPKAPPDDAIGGAASQKGPKGAPLATPKDSKGGAAGAKKKPGPTGKPLAGSGATPRGGAGGTTAPVAQATGATGGANGTAAAAAGGGATVAATGKGAGNRKIEYYTEELLARKPLDDKTRDALLKKCGKAQQEMSFTRNEAKRPAARADEGSPSRHERVPPTTVVLMFNCCDASFELVAGDLSTLPEAETIDLKSLTSGNTIGRVKIAPEKSTPIEERIEFPNDVSESRPPHAPLPCRARASPPRLTATDCLMHDPRPLKPTPFTRIMC